MKYLLILLLCITQLSCSEKGKRINVITDKFNSFVPADSAINYFSSADHKPWTDNILFKLKEPVLKDYKGNGEFIRFIWLRSFEKPIVIRVNRFTDTVYANIKESGLKDSIVNLSLKQWNEFADNLTKSGFWNNASEKPSNAQDGVIWFIESSVGGRYKLMEGWDWGHIRSPILRNYLDPLIYFSKDHVRLITKKGIH